MNEANETTVLILLHSPLDDTMYAEDVKPVRRVKRKVINVRIILLSLFLVSSDYIL